MIKEGDMVRIISLKTTEEMWGLTYEMEVAHEQQLAGKVYELGKTHSGDEYVEVRIITTDNFWRFAPEDLEVINA